MADSDFNSNEIAIQCVQQANNLRLSVRELQQANEWRINQANILMFEDLLRQASQLLDYQGETNSDSRQQNAEGTVEFSMKHIFFDLLSCVQKIVCGVVFKHDVHKKDVKRM